MRASLRRPWQDLAPLGLALVVVLGPILLALALQEGSWLAHPDSELPVRIWCLDAFSGSNIMGSWIRSVGHPYPGVLSNPDPIGSLVWTLVEPALGDAATYNLLVLGIIAANTLAAWLLARDHVDDSLAAATAAVALGAAPVMLSYPLASAIDDVLHLWPWLLALRYGLRALRRPGWGDGLLAGTLGGMGCIASLHNFLIVSVLILPLALGLPLAAREQEDTGDGALLRPPPRQWLRGLGAAALTMLPIALGWLYWVRVTMHVPGGQMSTDTINRVRHYAPFPNLHTGEGGYVLGLVDYLGLGSDALFTRDLVSHQAIAATPGVLVLALALAGLLVGRSRPRTQLMWLGAAAFAALASTGPFLALTRSLELPVPANPAWLAAYYAIPGGRMVLEPFRYAIPVAMALVVPVAFGARAVREQLGVAVGWALPVLVAVEVLALSPTPFPQPVADLRVPAAYAHLDEHLGPGAIVELPLWDGASSRFVRRHFLHQRVHGRPIMDEVAGFLPRYLPTNELLVAAVLVEGFRPGLELGRRGDPSRDVPKLAHDGFAGVVVDPLGYASPEQAARVVELLSVMGPPVDLGDRLLFRVPEQEQEQEQEQERRQEPGPTAADRRQPAAR
jgi:hypothetical protein